MSDKWKEDIQGLVGKDLCCRYDDGKYYYRAVIDHVSYIDDAGAWLALPLSDGGTHGTFLSASACASLLKSGKAICPGIRASEVWVLPHDDTQYVEP